VITTHSDRSGIGGGGERESSQRGQDGNKRELRGEEDHVWQLEMKRPVAETLG